MTWYNYVSCFISAALLTNALPHFLHGISGDRFPTPFAKPPGQGLSSALTNVLWGLFNLFAGLFLLKINRNSGAPWDHLALFLFSSGIVVISIGSSMRFKSKHKE